MGMTDDLFRRDLFLDINLRAKRNKIKIKNNFNCVFYSFAIDDTRDLMHLRLHAL